jgi:fibronectin type 3 domain-containing protein
MTLHAGSYDWQFIPAAGDGFTDSGSASCHWPNAKPPAAPVLSTTADDAAVRLSWTAPADGGSAIRGYKLYRGTAPGTTTLYKTLGNGTSYNDTAVENGKRYYYRVTATNGKGDGPQSGEVLGARPAGEPSVTAHAGDGAVQLSWAAPPDGGAPITGYKIYRGTSPGNVSALKTVGAVNSYTDPGLTNDKTYHYKVAAVNSVGQGRQSGAASATPAPVPAAPGLTASLEGGSVSLSWNVPKSSSPILGYRVYRGTFPGGETLLTSTVSATFALDSGLVPGVTYYYRVAAVNRIGEGPRSDTVAVGLSPVGGPPGPAGPAGPAAGSAIGSLRLTPSTFVPLRSRAKGGAQVTYSLSGTSALVVFSVERALPGVLKSGKCAKSSRRVSKGKRCTRFTRVRGSIQQSAVTGRNVLCFSGRLGKRTLEPGPYRLNARLKNATQTGTHANFRIARKGARAKQGC